MAKLAIVLFVTLTICFGFLDTAKSAEEVTVPPPEEGEERSAYGQAGAAANARGLYRPGPQSLGPATGPVPGSVQCYSCIDCPEVNESHLKFCPLSLDPSKAQKCVTYAEKYRNQKEAVIRGCVSERGNCAEIKSALDKSSLHVRLVHCNVCQGDKCNGATRTLTDLTMAFMALLVTPLVAKITLS